MKACIICSSRFSVIILEKAAENAIPINIKFKTGFGITTLLKKNPTPDVSKILPIKITRVAEELLSFFNIRPARIPVTAPITKGRITTSAII